MFELADEADERVSFAGTLDFNAELEADQIDTVTHLEVAVYDELAGVSEPESGSSATTDTARPLGTL